MGTQALERLTNLTSWYLVALQLKTAGCGLCTHKRSILLHKFDRLASSGGNRTLYRVCQVENTGKFACRICKKGAGVNSLRCAACSSRNVTVLGGDCNIQYYRTLFPDGSLGPYAFIANSNSR